MEGLEDREGHVAICQERGAGKNQDQKRRKQLSRHEPEMKNNQYYMQSCFLLIYDTASST